MRINENPTGFKLVNSAAAMVIAAVLVIAIAGLSGCTVSHQSVANTQASSYVSQQTSQASSSQAKSQTYQFKSKKRLTEHFEKHGAEMDYADAQAYLAGANAVISNPESLHKYEREDGDDVYYLEKTDEIVFVSTDGYIRTYFKPGGIDYFNRQ